MNTLTGAFFLIAVIFVLIWRAQSRIKRLERQMRNLEYDFLRMWEGPTSPGLDGD
jgi:membrane protein CcdC involved in cytochrome C biogenesis